MRKNSPKRNKNKIKNLTKIKLKFARNYILSQLKWADENPEAKELIIKILKETHGF